MKMEMYLYDQANDLFKFYHDKMKEEKLYGGHVGLMEYLLMLDRMDPENMKDWERRMMAEIN